MFGGIGIRTKKKPEVIEEDEPVITESKVNPCDDEPKEWSKFSEPELAEAWYRLESLSLGSATQPKIDTVDIFQWYLNAAANGDRCAQYAVGKMYHRGILTQSVLFQAGIWYSRASGAGSPFADYEMAKMCEYGITMAKDADMATALYKKAYAALVDIENRSPDRAVEKKLAALCDKGAAADPQEAEHWKKLAVQPVEPEAVAPVENSSPGPDVSEKADVSEKNKGRPCSTMNLEDIPVQYIYPSKKNKFAEHDTDESVHALSLSIQVNGLAEPLTLNKISDTEYRIIAGERRFKAITRYLHWDSVPAIIQNNLSATAAQSLLNAANLDVRNYTAGQKLQFYMDYEQQLRTMQESGEFTGSIQDGIAELLGVSSHQIRKYQRIVDMLPKRRLKQVQTGQLSIEKAYKMTFAKENGRESGACKDPEVPKNDHGRTSVSTSIVSASKEQKSINSDVKITSETGPGNSSIPRENSGIESGEFSTSADVVITSENVRGRASVLGINQDASSPTMMGKDGSLSSCVNEAIVLGTASGRTSISDETPTKKQVDKGTFKPCPDTQNTLGRTSVLDEKRGINGEDFIPVLDVKSTSENSPGYTSVSGGILSEKGEDETTVFMPSADVQPTSEMPHKFASILNKDKDEILRHVSIQPAGKTDVKNASDVTSVFRNPGSYQEAVEMLTELPAEPGDNCTVIEGNRAIPGVIDRIELYSNALMILVSFNGTSRSYPVSQIGKTLFIGGEKQAGSA